MRDEIFKYFVLTLVVILLVLALLLNFQSYRKLLGVGKRAYLERSMPEEDFLRTHFSRPKIIKPLRLFGSFCSYSILTTEVVVFESNGKGKILTKSGDLNVKYQIEDEILRMGSDLEGITTLKILDWNFEGEITAISNNSLVFTKRCSEEIR